MLPIKVATHSSLPVALRARYRSGAFFVIFWFVETWTIKRIIEWTTRDLHSRGIPSAKLDAEVLLAHALGTDRLDLFLNFDRPLDEQERTLFRKMISRRRQREPVAYITGHKEFWKIPLAVSSNVLIPRPDTEVIVEEVLELIPEDSKATVVDVGTGTGCIALSLAFERPQCQVIAVDCDQGAATLAQKNAESLELDNRVKIVVGDLLGPIEEPVSLIVSNLPYIPSDEIDVLEPEVAKWEPRLALDGGQDGLDVFRRLIEAAPDKLEPGGWLVLEVGHGKQAREVSELLEGNWDLVKIRQDYGHQDRVVIARKKLS